MLRLPVLHRHRPPPPIVAWLWWLIRQRSKPRRFRRFAYSVRIRPKGSGGNRGVQVVPPVNKPRRPWHSQEEVPMLEVQITTAEEAVIDFNPIGADGLPKELDGPIQPEQVDGDCSAFVEGDDGTILVVQPPTSIPDETESVESNFNVRGDAAHGAPVVFLTEQIRVVVVHERAVSLNPTVTIRPRTARPS